MVKVSIETVGEERFIRGFNRIPPQMADMRPVFREIAYDFGRIERYIFSRQGYPEPFKPLSASYAKWKAKSQYAGKPIMQLKGDLRRSLINMGGPKIPGMVKIIGQKSAEFGSELPYAHRHQMGTAGMPQRKIVHLTEGHKIRWGRLMHNWALKIINKELK